MDLLFSEDFLPGSIREFGDYPVTRDAIVAFASEFDPQPFHVDEKAGAASMLGGLAASGWHTLAIMMRLLCLNGAFGSAAMEASGIGEVRWLKPVRPGDRLSVRMKIEDLRASTRSPDTGRLSLSIEVLNQTGAVVAQVRHLSFLDRNLSLTDMNARQTRSEGLLVVAEPQAGPDLGNDAGDVNFGYYESVILGRTVPLGRYLFRKEDMVRFARAFDPQPFHLDEEAPAYRPFKHLTASGWNTAAAFMRCLIDTKTRLEGAARARGETPPLGGPSPGLTDLHWLGPIFPGDIVSFSATAVGKRATSRPGWGLVFAQNIGVNQNGLRVFEYSSTAFWPLTP